MGLLERIAVALEKNNERTEGYPKGIDTHFKRTYAGKQRAKQAERDEKGRLLPAQSSISPAQGENQRRVIAAYCQRYKLRYGINPPVGKQDAGLCKGVLDRVSADKACELVQAYVQMDDPWFLKMCHDFVTFARSLPKVAVALANGTQNPHDRAYWEKVFGEGEWGGNEKRNVPGTNKTNASDVGGTFLPSGEE